MSIVKDSLSKKTLSDEMDLANLANTRRQVYKLLSTMYLRSPDKKVTRSLSQFFSEPKTSVFLEKIPENVRKSFLKISSSITSSGDGQKSLQIDFTNLLRGFRPNIPPLPPYESVYRGEDRTFGVSTFNVSSEYANADVKIADEYRGEPPDHIGIELDFMAHLCRLEAKAWHECDYEKCLEILKQETRFLEEHLMIWVFNFCDQIKNHSRTDFYIGLAEATENWVDLDYEQINDISKSW
ncbi:MAG: molecular chaperone TorD family protein [Thaumarchaeota archaeon]|nr:molecular chaperone TorD family protein [Nitrososphaerota archaeon]